MKMNLIAPRDASPETKRLIEMYHAAEDDFSVSEAVKKHPELVSGLDGYMQIVLDEGKQICEKTATPYIGHSMRRLNI